MGLSPASGEGVTEVAGRRLSFLAAGEGPTVLLLHGFGADRLSWLLTQREMAAYAATIAPDLPGHGRSDRDVGDGSIGALTDLVSGFVEARGDGPVHIVGHSLGGAIGIDMAHRRPDLVASLFLLAPAGLGRGIDPAFLSALVDMGDLEQASAVLGRLVMRRRLISPQMTTRALAEIATPGTRDALRKVADGLLKINEHLAPAVAGVADSDIPKAVVWGEGDTINPVADEGPDRLGARLHIVEDAGHLPHIESHATVNGLIRDFVTGAATRPT